MRLAFLSEHGNDIDFERLNTSRLGPTAEILGIGKRRLLYWDRVLNVLKTSMLPFRLTVISNADPWAWSGSSLTQQRRFLVL